MEPLTVLSRVSSRPRLARCCEPSIVSMISRSGVDGLQAPLNSGLQDGLKRQDLHMIYSEINESSFAESGVAPRLLRELCVDGLIVHYARNVPDSFRRLAACLAGAEPKRAVRNP